MNDALIFALIYVIVDYIYVYISLGYYDRYIAAIQGKPRANKLDAAFVALISYVILGGSWWILVANRLTSESSYWDLLSTGVIFGIAIYGVFNTTMYVMFDKWDWKVAVRDTLWGTSWATLLSFGYLWWIKTKNEK